MRVTYLHQYFTVPSGPGPSRSYEFARRLLQWGHDVHLITSSAHVPREQLNTDGPRATVAGIPTTLIDVPYANTMSFGERIRAFLRFAYLASVEAMRSPADVIFASSTPLTIALPGIVAGARRRVPFVFEIRDLWPELPIAVGAIKSPPVKLAAQGLEWTAYHCADHVIAASPGMAAGVLRRGIPATRVSVIPNGCDVDSFDVPAARGERVRAALNLAVDQPLIVYAGAFGLLNGVSYMVDLAAEMRAICPRARFLLVGSGAERAKVGAHAAARQVLGHNLWIWDPVPKEQMPDILAAASVASSLFIPLEAMRHNSANKFFDGLAAGKPVAINYEGWQADLLREHGAGVVLPADSPRRAAEELAALVGDQARLRAAGGAARELARTQFNRDRLARAFESVLQRAVAGR